MTATAAALLSPVTRSLSAPSVPSGAQIADSLDGDYATITSVTMQRVTSGTAPFDKDDAPGNDSSDSNLTIRSFDTATYAFEYVTTPHTTSPYQYFRSARVRLTATLHMPKSEARFDTSALAWADTTKGYEPKVTESSDGRTQTLTAWRRLEPDDRNPTVIPGTSALQVSVQVRDVLNGQTVRPDIAVSLEHNADGDAMAAEAPALTVSAKPKYNVMVKAPTYTNYTPMGSGTFDFSQGDATAPDKGAGKVRGRLYAYGVSFAVWNDTPEKGMRGVEMPSGSASFTLRATTKVKHDGKTEDGTDYAPYLYGAEGYTNSMTANGGRPLPANGFSHPYGTAALNTPSVYQTPDGTRIVNGVSHGGTWSFAREGDGSVRASISGVAADPDSFPAIPFTGNAAWTKDNHPIYYDGKANIGIVSTARILLVQPFDNRRTGQSANEEFNAPNIDLEVTLADSGLSASGRGGTPIATDATGTSNQMVRTDDAAVLTYNMTLPGGWTTFTHYTHPDLGLSSVTFAVNGTRSGPGYTTGDDSIMSGKPVRAVFGYNEVARDSPNLPVYGEALLKFDDSVLSLDGDGKPFLDAYHTVLWAAKPDGTGWRDDAEQKAASIDSLEYYASADALRAAGKRCVGVLVRNPKVVRNVSTFDYYYFTSVRFLAPSDSASIGKTAMVTVAARTWRRADVDSAVAKAAGKPEADVTDDDRDAWLATLALQGTSLPGKGLAASGLRPFADRNSGPLYEKGRYDAAGNYEGGHTGGMQYGDTIRIVGEDTRVTVGTAQAGTDASREGGKVIYDMDYLQRHADWVVSPTVSAGDSTGKGIPTTVTVRVSLPKGLAYEPGSAFLGGAYSEQTPDAGKVTGGKASEPKASANADGTQSLEWSVPVADNSDATAPRIRFSTSIGTPGDEDTDVSNLQQLTVTATAVSTYGTKVIDAGYGNKYSLTIQISKLHAASLSIVARPRLNEVGGELQFDSRAGNFGNQAMTDAYAVNLMPWAGSGSPSAYHGTYRVNGLAIQKTGLSKYDDVSVYATTDAKYRRGTSPKDVTLAEVKGWTRLAYDPATGKATVPDSMAGSIVAWAVVKGSLPANEQVRTLATIKPDGNAAADHYTILWSDGKNTVRDTVYVVSRSVSGTVWDDGNRDGIRQDGEERIAGAVVSLTDSGGKAVTDLSGKPASTVTDAKGTYLIGNLPAGDYRVSITPKAAGGWDGYEATTKDAGGDDAADSDADAVSAGGKLTGLVISGISLPVIEKMAASTYASEHNDAGIRVVAKPGLAIEKTYAVDGHEDDAAYKVRGGDVIRYKAKVTNTGNVALAPVTVTDDKTGIKGKKVSDSLEPGKSIDNIDLGTHTVTQTDIDAGKDIENTAYAHGEPPAGVTPPEDPHDTVETPPDSIADIAIAKTNDVKGHEGDAAYKAKVGDVITYKVTITNTGTTTLAPVSVKDPFLGIDSWKKAADSLAPGKSVTLTDLGTHTVTQAEIDAGKDIVNTAYAHGEPPVGVTPPEDPHADTPRSVAGEPGIQVVKTASLVADANGNGKYDVGDEIGYAIKVTNTGSLTLTSVTIDDVLLGVKGMKVSDTMAPGDSVEVSASKLPAHTITATEALSGRVDNTVTATGRPPRGNPPTDDDTVTITTVVPKPALAIKKVATIKPKDGNGANGTAAGNADGNAETESAGENGTAGNGDGSAPGNDQGSGAAGSSSAFPVKMGDVIEYSAVVTNTGNVDMASVSVSDAMLGMDGKVVLQTLSAGKSASVSLGEHVVTQEDVDAGKVVNDVSAHGVPPKGIEPPEDPTDEVVTTIDWHPGIRVEKVASLSEDADGDGIGDMGDVISYSIKVTNTGSLTLTDVTVDDDLLGISGLKVADSMAPGETVEVPAGDVPTHTITAKEAHSGKVVNGVDAKGTPPSGDDVTAHDEVATPTHEEPTAAGSQDASDKDEGLASDELAQTGDAGTRTIAAMSASVGAIAAATLLARRKRR